MKKRILVANRGEVARRIIKTINILGHTSIALKLPKENSPYYLKEASEVLTYESDDPRLSFLDEIATVNLALKYKIDLIHPGYGFLSESGSFAKKVEESGILFIGPSSDTLYKLGDKISAKKLAVACGIPIIEGITLVSGEIDKKTLQVAIQNLSFPLIVKAGAGGGGRGMRIAQDIDALLELIPGARLEAKRNFGNDELFIETFLQNVRHIEVQVLGDKLGSQIHLFERDCSLQRKFQKIIEIAPAMNVSEEILSLLYKSSLKLAKSADLTNATTFEFLVDTSNQKYFFIEANPRLQVEHTITEEITGLDIVELQINSALGLPLLLQKDITKSGVSVQVRICAELPEEDFTPAVGRIESWITHGQDSEIGIRKDIGYAQGETIGTDFDSLLGKIIATEENLTKCIGILVNRTLPVSVPQGIRTNIPFLISILKNLPDSDRINTKWIENTFLVNYPQSYQLLEQEIKEYSPTLFNALIKYETHHNPSLFNTNILRPGSFNQYRIQVAINSSDRILLEHLDEVGNLHVEENGNYITIEVGPQKVFLFSKQKTNDTFLGTYQGVPFKLSIENYLNSSSTQESAETEIDIKAPLPGTIISIHCKPGEQILVGVPILSIESMKTEHKLSSIEDCIVETVNVIIGDQVQKGQILVHCSPHSNKRED